MTDKPAVRGEEFRRQLRKALATRGRAARNRRGKRSVPQITGIRIPPPEDHRA